MAAASRRPVQDVEVQRFLPLVHQSLKAGRTFIDSMRIAYKVVLCAPEFFTDLVRENLPAHNIVDSDFVTVNERLAKLYELPSFEGVQIRHVSLPPNSPRGGIMTQASVLKVTADGIATSPVLRGAWIMERILGKPSPPPPKNIVGVEPDTRGTTTIRQQLDKHREVDSCAMCHKDIDPPGFAMESFDVAGGWRDRYRATSDNKDQAEPGIGHGGQSLLFHHALPVDSSSALPDGRSFADVREFKQLLLTDEPQIARNLVQQLLIYATGTPMLFSDRSEIEVILDRARETEFATRTLIHELVQSELFLNK